MATDPAAGLSIEAFDGTELDFWLGEWDARWGEVGRGTNRLTRILGGKVIREEFSGGGANGHLEGLSLSVFDPARRLWQQTWVDDQGGYLDLVGDVVDGCFAFRRDAPEDGPATGKTLVGIYKIEGKVLTICFTGTGGARPTEFKSGDRNTVLAVYERKEEVKSKK